MNLSLFTLLLFILLFPFFKLEGQNRYHGDYLLAYDYPLKNNKGSSVNSIKGGASFQLKSDHTFRLIEWTDSNYVIVEGKYAILNKILTLHPVNLLTATCDYQLHDFKFQRKAYYFISSNHQLDEKRVRCFTKYKWPSGKNYNTIENLILQ